MKTRWLSMSIVFASLAWSAVAGAGVPSPPQSSVDPCLIVCPLGDIAFHVTVRDIANLPVGGSTVLIDFCSCVAHGFDLCPGISCQVTAVTNPAGTATFHISAGGAGCASPVNVFADGVLLAQRRIASPDQNGDLVVDAADAAILAGKFGTTDPTGDLDCDGSVTPGDQSARALHSQHSCGVVPTKPQSWGSTKAFYR